jgi:hypothetical protein
MIRIEELNPRNFPVTDEIAEHLNTLLHRLNEIRSLYKRPMIITSGLRSAEHQNKLITQGVSNAKKSKHLLGQAADVQCNGGLKNWVLDNIREVERIQLWMEDFTATPTWVHFQIVPPRSGKRFFLP